LTSCGRTSSSGRIAARARSFASRLFSIHRIETIPTAIDKRDFNIFIHTCFPVFLKHTGRFLKNRIAFHITKILRFRFTIAVPES